MKKIDKILEKTENGLPQQSWTSRTSIGEPRQAEQGQATSAVIDDRTKALVNMIFARFMAIYGFKFKSAFETEDELRIAKREWALSLTGVSESAMVQAVNQCKETLSWMPTIAEFLKILDELSDESGLPDLHSAFEEACRYAGQPSRTEWSHPLVYWAGQATGWFELRSEPAETTFPRFRYQYDVLKRRVQQGEALDETPVPVALEDHQSSTAAEQMLEFAKVNEISEEQACQLLYYLTLPRGSKVRQRQYARASASATRLNVELPTAS